MRLSHLIGAALGTGFLFLSAAGGAQAYDHEHDRGEMRRLEERLRRRAGLREGLISRTRA